MEPASADALRRTRLNNLPSPPDLLLPLMRLCTDDEAVPADASRVIGRDSALSTRMLAAASAPVFGQRHPHMSLDAAVHALGMNTVRSLALAATVQQYFGVVGGHDREWFPRIWRRAIACATIGHQLARHCGNAHPEEAYLAGLLHNIGQLAMSHQLRDDYAALLNEAASGEHHLASLERDRFGIDHVSLGAELLERWHVPTLVVDAVRFQQESVEHLADAHALVRTTALARTLAPQRHELDAVTRHAAACLFDLGPTAVVAILGQAADEQERIHGALGDAAASPPAVTGRDGPVAQELRQATLIGDVRRHLRDDAPVDGIARCAVLLFGIRHMLCLQCDSEHQLMRVLPPSGADPRLAELTLPLERGRSLMAECLLDGQPVHTLDPAVEPRLSVVDRQLQAQLPGDGLLCLPMATGEAPAGVLVLGIRHDQVSALLDESPLLLAFAREAGDALQAADRQRQRQNAAVADGVAAARVDHDDLVREASEPLTILRNYLATLETHIEHGDPARGQLLALNEEADRLSRLLSAHDDTASEPRTGCINQQVRRAIRVAERGGALPANARVDLRLNQDLDGETGPAGPETLQQILLNLLRVIGGHLGGGVTLSVRTTGLVETSGRRYIEILLEHDGADLPAEIRQHLLGGSAPGGVPRGADAEGLNVAVTLLRDTGGLLTYRWIKSEGARMQIMVPPA